MTSNDHMCRKIHSRIRRNRPYIRRARVRPSFYFCDQKVLSAKNKKYNFVHIGCKCSKNSGKVLLQTFLHKITKQDTIKRVFPGNTPMKKPKSVIRKNTDSKKIPYCICFNQKQKLRREEKIWLRQKRTQ